MSFGDRINACVAGSTGSRLLLDALPLVDTDAGRRLVEIIRRHHRAARQGMRDPDRRFRDFQNHVIHVHGGFWGGGPRVAHRWLCRAVDAAARGRRRDAAHAIGVMMHYVFDALHPLHTEQNARERVLHFPVEAITYLNYERFLDRWRHDDGRAVSRLPGGPTWLGEHMMRGAANANADFWTMLCDFDIRRCVDEPSKCFGGRFERATAAWVGICVTSAARIIERAGQVIADRRDELELPAYTTPTFRSDAVAMFAAAPFGTLRRRRDRRRLLKRLQNHVRCFVRDGDVESVLPAEVRIVHRVVDVHHHEQRWRRLRGRDNPFLRLYTGDAVDGYDQPESRHANSAAIKPSRRAA